MSSMKVEGMSCGHCVNTIKEAVQKENNAGEVHVDLEKKLVTWTGSLDAISVKKIIEAQGFIPILN